MNKIISFIKEKYWNNIWWWRLFAIGQTFILVYVLYWVWFEVLPDYRSMYDALELLGYLP